MKKIITMDFIERLLVTLIVYPIIYVGIGFVGGLVVKWTFGELVSTGFNSLSDPDRFKPDYIPYMVASLSLVISYFNSNYYCKDNKDVKKR